MTQFTSCQNQKAKHGFELGTRLEIWTTYLKPLPPTLAMHELRRGKFYLTMQLA